MVNRNWKLAVALVLMVATIVMCDIGMLIPLWLHRVCSCIGVMATYWMALKLSSDWEKERVERRKKQMAEKISYVKVPEKDPGKFIVNFCFVDYGNLWYHIEQEKFIELMKKYGNEGKAEQK